MSRRRRLDARVRRKSAVAARILGVVGGTVPLARTTSGLLLFDDFDTAGVQNDIGNGWTEVESAATDLRTFDGDSVTPGLDKNDQDNVTDAIERSMAGLGITLARGFLIDWTTQVRATTNDSQIEIRAYWDKTPNDWYDCAVRDTNNRLVVREIEGGSITQEDSNVYTDGIGRPNAYRARFIIDKSGADPVIKGYEYANAPHSASDMKPGALTLRSTITDTGGDINGDVLSIQLHDKSALYNLLICKDWVVKVTGLPLGWKAQLDSGAAVSENGGTATIDVSTVQLPATTIKVLDDGDVEQATLTPDNIAGRRGAEGPGGIVGGDIFEYSA